MIKSLFIQLTQLTITICIAMVFLRKYKFEYINLSYFDLNYLNSIFLGFTECRNIIK